MKLRVKKGKKYFTDIYSIKFKQNENWEDRIVTYSAKKGNLLEIYSDRFPQECEIEIEVNGKWIGI